jgi:predicted MFS family arabinose efflux permease
MGIAASFNVLANMVGPTVGGQLAAAVGIRQIFFMTGAIMLLTVLFVKGFFMDLRGNDPTEAPGPPLPQE